jgi:hypothetical protein
MRSDPLLSSSTFRTVTARDFDALVPHLRAWDCLAWEAPQRTPVLLPGWIEAFIHHRLKPTESWLCSFAYLGERLVGVLPVIVIPHPVLGRRRPLLRTPVDVHTVSGDITLAQDCAPAAFKALLAEVGCEVPHHLGIELRAVRNNSPVWLALRDRTSGYIVCNGLCRRYSFLDLKEGSKSYWAGLSKMRQSLRRARRRLEQRGPISVELRTGFSAGEDFLWEFLALEASGWKGRMGTAILNDPNLVAFYTALVRNFANRGRLEWHGIRVGGRLVAGQLGVRCGMALILLKYAYDEDFAECSPGHLLTEAVFNDAFSRSELVEVNPMSSADHCGLWHMASDKYIDVHLVRRGGLPVLVHFPYVAALSTYQNHVRPRIPPTVKRTYRWLKRKQELKRRRAREPLDSELRRSTTAK